MNQGVWLGCFKTTKRIMEIWYGKIWGEINLFWGWTLKFCPNSFLCDNQKSFSVVKIFDYSDLGVIYIYEKKFLNVFSLWVYSIIQKVTQETIFWSSIE